MKSTICRKLLLSCLFIALATMTAYGQGRGQRGGFGGGRGGFGGGPPGFGGGNPFGGATSDVAFATRSDVSEELNLSDDQESELRELRRDSPNMFRMMQEEGIDFRSMAGMSSEERQEELAPVMRKMEKANQELSEEVYDILKTSQKARFRELKFQYELTRGNFVAALTAGDVELDKGEKEDLEAARREVGEKLQKRIEELRQELYMAALKDAGYSESKVEDMMGKKFTFTADRGRRGGGEAGGRGRRGGEAGGRGGDRNARRGGEAGGRGRRGGDDEDANPRRRQRPN